jgi:site-specific DNA-methyltransferase (cytosine-N4-specific)
MSPKELATVNGGHRRGFFPLTIENPLGKLPGSVWEIASQPLKVPGHLAEDHFAAFPMELPRRCILGWCPVGGVVADPFGGTGTTALVAEMLGRTGLSFDLSADYCRLARWRTTDPAERARALGVPKPPPVIPGQLDLLTGEAS